MKKFMQAEIEWITPEDGGRKTVMPITMRYCPVIVFEQEQSGGSLWSAEIYNIEIHDRKSIAKVSFLMETAPFHLLSQGNKFSLYEGPRVVGEGIITAELVG